MGEKIVVGVSGGVDSSMALLLLKKKGWEPIGVTLKVVGTSKKSISRAKAVCKKLGIKHYVIDASKDFRKKVMGYFDSELRKARTPNPCVMCNPNLKFLKLLEFANKHGVKFIATGHYALAEKGKLLMPKDSWKDQTYGLSFLPRKMLPRVIFPLGKFTKKEIYAIAQKNGFNFDEVNESQDICFAQDLRSYLDENISNKFGFIKEEKGSIIAEHNGLHYYTIGQKTLGYYVKSKDAKTNTLYVAKDRSEILSKEAFLKPFNLLQDIPAKLKVMAKVRYKQKLAKATLIKKKGKLQIIFDKPQEAITPGQCCTFYKGKQCLGGGIIL
jgi:tRNA-uridine 2-sulfurtransferase